MDEQEDVLYEEYLTVKRLAAAFGSGIQGNVWTNGQGVFTVALYGLSIEQVESLAAMVSEGI